MAVRVLFVAERYPPDWVGGSELSGALVAGLVTRIPGFSTRVLTQGDGTVGDVQGVRVERTIRRAARGVPDDLTRGPLLTARAAPTIARAARDADVVHSLSTRAIPAVVAGARLAGRPATSVVNDPWAMCFTHSHVRGGRFCGRCTPEGLRECVAETGGNARAAPLLWLEFRRRMDSLSGLAGVVAIAPVMKRLLEACGATVPITVIPVPVDIAAYDGGGSGGGGSGSGGGGGGTGRAAEPGLVTFVGRVSTGKGVLEAIGVFAEVARDRPRARFEIVGDGPMLDAARARARELGLGDRVVFRGRLPPEALPGELARAQLVLAPFVRVEAFGRVGLEAAAARRPVLTTDLWGGADVLGLEPGAGVVVPWDDRTAWAAALGRMLDDPEGCTAMGLEARKRLEAIYADSALERAYRAFFEGVLAGRA